MLPIDKRALLRAEYTARINRVIDYIDRNIGRDLRLEELAKVANFSPFHFHRIFGALVGEPLNAFIQRVRAERAANALLDKPKASITEIALDCGYSGSAAFARAFRDRFGMSASEWREGGSAARSEAWRKKRQTESKNGQALRKIGEESGTASSYPEGEESSSQRRPVMSPVKIEVEVRELPELRVAYVRHIGPFQGVKEAFEKLMRWAGPRGLLRFPQTKMLAVYHDNPSVTETDKLRSSACVTVPAGTKVEGEIGEMTIPGGLFAVAKTEIFPNEFGEAWDALMRDWLPESGYQPDDRMCYELYLNDPRTHPQGKFILEICQPIRPL
jgi:AraC family transcriptional regulator